MFLCYVEKRVHSPEENYEAVAFHFRQITRIHSDDMKVHPQTFRMSFMYNPKIITRKSCSTKRMNGRRDLICKSRNVYSFATSSESLSGLITREEKLIMSSAVSMSTTLFERVIQLFVV